MTAGSPGKESRGSAARSCPLRATGAECGQPDTDVVPEGRVQRDFSEALAAVLGDHTAGLSATSVVASSEEDRLPQSIRDSLI